MDIFERLSPCVAIESDFLWSCRLIVVVIDGHPQFLLDVRRFSCDLAIYVNVSVDEFDGFAGQSYHAFYIIYARLKRVFEYDDVPSQRFGELVKAFEYEYSVSLHDGFSQ